MIFLFGEELINNMIAELLVERLDEKINENETNLQDLMENIKKMKEILPNEEFLKVSKSYLVQWYSLMNVRSTLLYIEGDFNKNGSRMNRLKEDIKEFRKLMGLPSGDE